MERWPSHFQIDARLRPSISSNFFLKTNFLDRSFLENPSFERDSFILGVFYDRSNSATPFLEMCMSCSRALHTSTNYRKIRNVIREAAHVTQILEITPFVEAHVEFYKLMVLSRGRIFTFSKNHEDNRKKRIRNDRVLPCFGPLLGDFFGIFEKAS